MTTATSTPPQLPGRVSDLIAGIEALSQGFHYLLVQQEGVGGSDEAALLTFMAQTMSDRTADLAAWQRGELGAVAGEHLDARA